MLIEEQFHRAIYTITQQTLVAFVADISGSPPLLLRESGAEDFSSSPPLTYGIYEYLDHITSLLLSAVSRIYDYLDHR